MSYGEPQSSRSSILLKDDYSVYESVLEKITDTVYDWVKKQLFTIISAWREASIQVRGCGLHNKIKILNLIVIWSENTQDFQSKIEILDINWLTLITFSRLHIFNKKILRVKASLIV